MTLIGGEYGPLLGDPLPIPKPAFFRSDAQIADHRQYFRRQKAILQRVKLLLIDTGLKTGQELFFQPMARGSWVTGEDQAGAVLGGAFDNGGKHLLGLGDARRLID